LTRTGYIWPPLASSTWAIHR